MKLKQLLLCGLAALLPLGAAAQQAHSAKWVNLRAGPARDYPRVARLGPRTPLAVQGCTAGFGWCDVIAPDSTRGWVYAGNIVYPYQSGQVPVIRYGAVIGIPIVTFVIGSYWDNYYRNRPWYHDRPHWAHHRPPPRPIVRPPVVRPPVVRPPPRPRPPPSVRPPGGGGRPPGGGGGRPDRPDNSGARPQPR